MKTNVPLVLVIVLLLAACSPKAGSTPAGTLPPIISETQTTASGQMPSITPITPPTSSVQVLSGEVEIVIEDFAFNPGTVTIAVGTTVKWGNKDTAQHTVTGDDGSWDSARLNKGDDFTFTFTLAGTYTLHYAVHPSMLGTIVVVSP